MPAGVLNYHRSLFESIYQDRRDGGGNAEKVATMMAEQAVAVLQASGMTPAEAEAINQRLSSEPLRPSFEILNSEEPLVRYYAILFGDKEDYRVEAVIRYSPTGQVEGFADPPTDELELEGVWWYKRPRPGHNENQSGHDCTDDARLAAHPQGVYLDMLDGVRHLPDSGIEEQFYRDYGDIFVRTVAGALADEAAELLQSADPEYTRHLDVGRIYDVLGSPIRHSFSWELASPDSDHLRVWSEFNWVNGVGDEYKFRVGGLAVMVPTPASEWEYRNKAERYGIDSVLLFSHFDGPVVLERVE